MRASRAQRTHHPTPPTTLLAPLLAAFLVFGGATAAGHAAADETVTVHLLVHTDLADTLGFPPGEPDPLPGTASCAVSVPAGSNAGDILDQAVADGCILEWDHSGSEGDRFVVSLDGLRAVGAVCILWPTACQFWEFKLNGEQAPFGIDHYSATADDLVEFRFQTA